MILPHKRPYFVRKTNNSLLDRTSTYLVPEKKGIGVLSLPKVCDGDVLDSDTDGIIGYAG